MSCITSGGEGEEEEEEEAALLEGALVGAEERPSIPVLPVAASAEAEAEDEEEGAILLCPALRGWATEERSGQCCWPIVLLRVFERMSSLSIQAVMSENVSLASQCSKTLRLVRMSVRLSAGRSVVSVLPPGALLGPKHGPVECRPQKHPLTIQGRELYPRSGMIRSPSRDRLSQVLSGFLGQTVLTGLLPGLSGARRGRWVGRSPRCVAAPPAGVESQASQEDIRPGRLE